jgi:hypothetical protein
LTAARGAWAALGALLAGGCGGPAAAPSPAPSGATAPAASAVAFEPASFDFGRVLPDRSLQKDFRLRNLGRAPVAIDAVTTDCGCLVVGAYARQLAPGASTVLTVQLQTPAQPGTLVRNVVVKTAAPNPTSLQLTLRATVVGDPKPAS